MLGRYRMSMIVLTMTITVIVVVILSSTVFASTRIDINTSSSSIKYMTATQQYNSLTGGTDPDKQTGLAATLDEASGEITMESTSTNVFDGDTGNESLVKKHRNLIEQGILRYAVYNSSLCETAKGLIVILDFSNYNITTFSKGFLSGLAYVLVGSNEKDLFSKQGATFTETNERGGALTVYDSQNFGNPITRKINLTLRGIYRSEGGLLNIRQSEITDGDRTIKINSYSVRIILPSMAKSVTLQKGSLIIDSVAALGAEIVPPDSVALGISHLAIAPKGMVNGEIDWGGDIAIEAGVVANKEHFHWITVTGHQMDFAFYRSLDAILDRVRDDSGNVVPSADNAIYELFKKAHAYSDFSYLFVSVQKELKNADTESAETVYSINIYDPPTGNINHTEEGSAATLSMMYWLDKLYHLQDKVPNGVTMPIYHYTRSGTNEIGEAGRLHRDATKTIIINGEQCHVVSCSHDALLNGHTVGFYSDNGNLYVVSNDTKEGTDNLFVVKHVTLNEKGEIVSRTVCGYYSSDGILYDTNMKQIPWQNT